MSEYTNIAATTAAVADRFLTPATSMRIGTYGALSNASPVWQGGCLLSVTHAQVGGVTDTLGTITFTGTDLSGLVITETITPVSAQTVFGTKIFRTVTGASGSAAYLRNAGAGSEDTVTFGCAAGSYVMQGSGKVYGILVNNTVAATVAVSDGIGTFQTIPASQAAGTFYEFDGLSCSGYLKVATTNTNNITIIHGPSLPSVYAMS